MLWVGERLPWKLLSILSGVTDLGSTTVPRWTAQLMRTCAGVLFNFLAVLMTRGSSTALGFCQFLARYKELGTVSIPGNVVDVVA